MTTVISPTVQTQLEHPDLASTFESFGIHESLNEVGHLNESLIIRNSCESNGLEYNRQTKESLDVAQHSITIQLSPTTYTTLDSVNPDRGSFYEPIGPLQEIDSTKLHPSKDTIYDNDDGSINAPQHYPDLPIQSSETTPELDPDSVHHTPQDSNSPPQQQVSTINTLSPIPVVDDTYFPESSLLAAANSGKLVKPSRFPSPTMENIARLRESSAASANPLDLLEFAMFLVEAAPYVLEDEQDQKVVEKTRDSLLLEAQKIVKRLATNGNIAKSGCSEAQFFLANCYGTGAMKIPIDPDKAFNLYLQGSKQNHLQCSYRVAVCYEIGTGTKRDDNRAIQFYRKAAKLGDPLSMYKLGIILLKGFLGVQKNEREGVSWIKRAAKTANQDHPQALHELGLIYEQTDVGYILPDLDYARELFSQAAQYGFAPSQYRLGLAYENGSLKCPVNPRRSIAWYSRAAEQGDIESELALSGWYLTGAEGILQQDNFQAYLWARRAADKGFSKAEYAIGYYTETGVGVEPNLNEAKRWYLRSAASGNRLAMNRLNNICIPDHEESRKKRAIRKSNMDLHSKLRECIIM
ncbi:hypothetical protein CLU79DRAFT_831336 [Phycomyces nitens]|nr:hypothetical protein CLU79DRAFT_831336 [Phycomyces nitens]